MVLKSSSIIIAILAVAMMSIVPVGIKLVEANEIEIGVVRLLVASFGLYIFIRVKRRFLLNGKQWLALMVLGLTFAAHWYTYFHSIKLSTASIGAIGVSTYGIHLIVLGRIFLKQPIHLLDILAIFAALGGLFLVSPELSWQSSYFQGLLWSIVSGFLYACLPILHQKSSNIATDIRAWGQFSFALVPFLLFGINQSWDFPRTDWYWLVALAVVSTLFAHSLWVKATTELPAVMSSIIYYLYVPAALLASFMIINEQITLNILVGASIIILANVMTLLSRVKASRSTANKLD
ncbi:MAG: DMT family transporter [Kangiellaceae bacterium]|jgi:drug/metabolite transporter (DMT)-like permease|nr:DMT family transporter [Kangiellaceae bacterium]